MGTPLIPFHIQSERDKMYADAPERYYFYCKPPEGCGAYFDTFSQLYGHRLSACPGSTRQPRAIDAVDSATMHQRVHTQCLECGERFMFPIALLLHIQDTHADLKRKPSITLT